MPVSEKQKQYAKAWDRENMHTLCCRVRTIDAEAFKEYCTAHNTTPSAVIKKHVFDCLEKYDAELKAAEKK